jgi:hypothetical protein
MLERASRQAEIHDDRDRESRLLSGHWRLHRPSVGIPHSSCWKDCARKLLAECASACGSQLRQAVTAPLVTGDARSVPREPASQVTSSFCDFLRMG